MLRFHEETVPSRYARDLLLYWFVQSDFRDSDRKWREKGDASGYGPIDREVGRYDIIVTNIESILYYCTSIFVIINPNRVTRGNEKGNTSNEARLEEYATIENRHKTKREKS